MNRFLTLLLAACLLNLPVALQAQYGDAAGNCNIETDGLATSTNISGYVIEIDTVTTHTLGPFVGMTTYRVYLTTIAPTDGVSAIVGDDEFPLSLATTTTFYQEPIFGGVTPGNLSAVALSLLPELAYDSWVTIGLDRQASSVEGEVNASLLAGSWDDIFESGQSFVVDDNYGSGWYLLPPTASNSLAGANLRVLIAQLTTDGDISGSFRAQVFPEGDQENDYRVDATFSMGEDTAICGCTDESASNYNPDATINDGNCIFDVPGCTFELACNFDPEATVDDGSCDFVSCYTLGCTDSEACNYDGEATVEDESCTYPSPPYDCEGNCLNDNDLDGVCDEFEVLGCPDSTACNYSGDATENDGSCVYAGAIYDCDGACINDVDADDICDEVDDCIGVHDECGVCNGLGAIYECGCSEIPLGNCDCNGNMLDALGLCGGSCEADENNNGICDDQEVEPSIYCGWGTYWNEDSMACVLLVPPYLGPYGDFSSLNPCYFNLDNSSSVGAEDLLSFLGVYGQSADCTGYADVANALWSCGDPVSYQGYDYTTVLIGEQCWFAENLRNENYRNGDAIPANLSDSEWQYTTSGAVAVYGEDAGCDNCSPDIDACDPAQSLNEYGRLYNWYAVVDARHLCPSGWHVPNDGEWMTMEMALGMSEAEANATNWRGTDQGAQMKTDYGWASGGNGTNSSDFSGLPGGCRNFNGWFDEAGDYGYWWSSSSNGSNAWNRWLYYVIDFVGRNSNFDERYGFSVRCVQDAE